MEKRMYFIYNPHAGMERIRSNLLDIIDVFSRDGYEVTVCPTRRRGDGTEATATMKEGYDILVCCGGDGTLDEVVAGMMKRSDRIPIGYVPAGSTNDFARTLQIPSNMQKAAEVISGGREFKCDTGSFNDRPFVYVAAFGLFTDVSYGTGQDLKNTFGHLAYIMEAFARLGEIKSCRMKVVHDGITEEDEYLFGMVSNSLSVAGISFLAKSGIILDDGLFEVTLVKMPSGPINPGNIATALMNGVSNEQVSFFRAKEVSFLSKEAVSWTLDGEFGGSLKRVRIENKHKSLSIMVPANANIPGKTKVPKVSIKTLPPSPA